MIDPALGIPDVAADEVCSRFVLQRSHIRNSDRSVKPDAFVPHPYTELSVTRHLMATEEEIWLIGEDVAHVTSKTLYGRADVSARTILGQRLKIEPDPVPGNPNHVNVCGWPSEKPAQKAIAQEIAALATFAPRKRASG